MRQFSGEHIAALLATAIAAAVLIAGARLRGRRWAVPVARALGASMITAYLVEQLTYALRGTWTARFNLPLQLTDVVTLVSVGALWRPEVALLVELSYFWAFSASVQAILTPDLGRPFPDVLYFTYFATHSGAVLAACLLVLGCRRVPRPGAAWRVYAITVAFAAVAAIATLLTGGNYMFLRHKPARGSLLDAMGPWPWYIVAGAALGLALFFALEALAGVLRRGEPTSRSRPPPLLP
jgi:hypothetical integral membrane protein (TIGR02206 family)